MSVTQYIGARYVPRFLDTYDPTQKYEALDVVDNGSGTSYISKKIVPPNTPLNNSEYWALYGSSSGAAINLQNQINDINSFLNENITTPEKFGAIGDGITDDTIAFQQALNNGKIIVAKNKYLISSTLTMNDGTYLYGGGTIIVDAASTNRGVSLNNNCHIDNIKFIDINETSYLSSGQIIWCDEKSNTAITRCSFNDIHLGFCINYNHSSNFEILYNYINGYAYAGIEAILSCEHFKINNNKVLNGKWTGNNNRYPIAVSGYYTTNLGPARFIECNYNYIEDSVPLWEGIDSHGCTDAEFIGNTIKNVAYGIAIGQPTNAGTLSENNNRLRICNNNIEVTSAATGYAYGIQITSSDSLTMSGNIEIRNNKIVASGPAPADSNDSTSGICLVTRPNGLGFFNVNIENNFVQGNFASLAITSHADQPLRNINIRNNTFIGSTSFQRLRLINCFASEYKNVNIIDNILADNSSFDIVGPTSYTGNELINYRNNYGGSGTYARDNFITTPKPSLPSDTSAKGIAGQCISCNASGNLIKWICKTVGSWLALSA